jgi:hypothetical protein
MLDARARARRLGQPGFERGPTEEAVSRLTVHHPAVRYRIVADKDEAADHVTNLTRALALQPYRAQVGLSTASSAALSACP